MRRIAAVLAYVLFSPVYTSIAVAQTVPELFARAKEQIKSGSWAHALETLDTLDAESAKPGNESLRAQLPAPLAFYRGVAHANLGDAGQAAADFGAFLALNPNAEIDRSQYSKKTVAAFEKAQKAINDRAPSLAGAYKSFQPRPDAASRYPADAEWGSGPVRWIMSDDEKDAWSRLENANERVDFVERFWAARPASFRAEFEKRVAFADESLAEDPEQRGSVTDRGMVFILMGPPTFAGRKPLRAGDDKNDNAGMSTVESHDEETSVRILTSKGKVPSWKISMTSNKYSGPGKKGVDSSDSKLEVWHYRRELLPKGIPYQQVDFEFVTRQGYGSNTLQRDSQPVETLAAARNDSLRK